MTQENIDSTDSPPSETHSAEQSLTSRQKVLLVGRAILNRLRFMAVLIAVALFIGYWDTVKSHWGRWTHPRAAAHRELPPGEEFFCSMDPQVTRSTYEPNGDVPNCPICGMPLSIHTKGHEEVLPVGITGRVRLSPDRVEMAGIKTVAVDYRPIAKQIKTVGYVAYDESHLSRVVSRVGGYVVKLFVDKNFTAVQKGEPLVEIDSPEVYNAAKVLIRSEQYGVARELADREKLYLLGFSEAEVRAIASAKEPPTSLVIRAPQSGHVIAKNIVVGASVEPKMTLFEVADLATVWIDAEVYENDIPFLHIGQEIEATVESYPNRKFTGKVALVHPHLEIATRTDRVRLELDNPNHVLRPGMFASVTINTPLETIEPFKTLAAKTARTTLVSQTGEKAKPQNEFLVVPEQAVVDTGARKIVYVERQAGVYEGVEVELGPRQDDFYPVLSGLSAADRVVAAGGFLVDAEARFNAAAVSLPAMPQQNHDKITADRPRTATVPSKDVLKNIDQMPREDREPATTQSVCPVTGILLGKMGVPVKVLLRGKPIYLCCPGCIGKANGDPAGVLKTLESKSASPHPDPLPEGEGM